jgi:hypothetical protein
MLELLVAKARGVELKSATHAKATKPFRIE